jgi:3,4-dihydroxy 2-butanone 4-phosphate synthase/GTP cyclohydrolase II
MRSSTEAAISAIGRGELTIVTDDERRENEGDLIMAAQAATPEKIAFMLRHTSGVICASLSGQRLAALELPPMVGDNQESQRTAFTVSVDLAAGVSTGISASDRARTIQALADPNRSAEDFVRPGHVFPLRARPGGVLVRPGHTEAALDLARLAGLQGAGVLCEVVSADGREMARGPELLALARCHDLPVISIAQLVRHRIRTEPLIQHLASARVPTGQDPFTCHAWASRLDGTEHIAFVAGDVAGAEPALVRVHSECLTGDVFGSERATAVRNWPMRCGRSQTTGKAWWCTSVATRAAASASAGSWRHTTSRVRGTTQWTPTFASGCRSTLASTASPRRSCSNSASSVSG